MTMLPELDPATEDRLKTQAMRRDISPTAKSYGHGTRTFSVMNP
jgi:hypothetical protein